MIRIPVGDVFEGIVNALKNNYSGFFRGLGSVIETLLDGVASILNAPPSIVIVLIITAIVFWFTRRKMTTVLSFLGLLLINNMQLWPETMDTLSLVLVSALICFIVGIPLGIWSAKSKIVEKIVKPMLDFMQTMPAFVYLIPAVLFFKIGDVPGVVATVIFATPPAVRLTNLGIRQVPAEIIEASKSFGSTSTQMLFKVQLPMALPTILAGVNQTIMLSLSMVVIAAMIGAGGLGEKVLSGITQLKIGLGFESGVAVVILAMILDTVTQSLGVKRKSKQ